MIKLPQIYQKNGYAHEIIFRDEVYAITKLTSNEDGRFICYEVFKIKKNKTTTLKGSIVEARESTPSNEAWGKDGYSVRTLEDAYKKIEIFKQRQWKSGKKEVTQN